MKVQIVHNLIKMIISLIISVIFAVLLLFFVYNLPTEKIEENVKKSASQLFLEGDHFSVFPNFQFMIQDNYSDANYLNAAMVDNNARGIFTGLYGLEYNNKNIKITYDSPVTVLNNVFQENANLEYKEYGRRFWNGYEIFVKPFLLFFTYKQIRYMNVCIELFLLLFLCVLMYKKSLTKYIVSIIISYIFLSPIPMAFSMSFSGFLYCAYIPCILMIIFNNYLMQKQLYPLFFTFIGIIVAFFNMNYFQLITFAYPLIFYYILNDNKETNKNISKIFFSLFFCWMFGFCGMFAMKWIVYEIFTKEHIIKDMITRIFYRISATAYYTGPPISRFKALFKNFYYVLINIPWLIIEIIYIIYIMYKFFKHNVKHKSKIYMYFKKSYVVLFLLISGLVIFRYLLFANHVYVHAWVTYKIVDAIILVFNVLIMSFVSGENLYNEKIPIDDEI